MKTLQPTVERRQSRGCGILFAIGWIIMSCWLFVLAATPLTKIPNLRNLFSGDFSRDFNVGQVLWALPPMLMMGVFILLGLFILGVLVWPLIPSLKVSRPEVTVSSEAVRPGDSFSFSFRQTFRSAADVKQASLQLLLLETATYRRGTDTYTVKHEEIAQQFEAPPRHFQAGETIAEQRLLQVPPQGMHTFVATNNKLRWIVRVKMIIAGWPALNEEYEIRVLPERS